MNMENMEQDEQNTKEIPEFYRDLKEDLNQNGLWYFTFRQNPKARRKPIQTPDNKPHKVDFKWSDLFGNKTNQIEIEVGSGKGHFLTEYAKKHPEISILGSEWDKTWAMTCLERLIKKNVTENTKMLCGDVFYFLRDAVPANSVDAFHMYFPDPWPKERHHKNRLLRPDFLVEVARTLKSGKRLFYWCTDHKEYIEVALDAFDHFDGCTVIERNTVLPTEGIMTGFETKYRKEGRPIYRSLIVFEK